jgi:hypothetical protein
MTKPALPAHQCAVRSKDLRGIATRLLRMAALASAGGKADFAAYCYDRASGIMNAWARQVRGNFRSLEEC